MKLLAILVRRHAQTTKKRASQRLRRAKTTLLGNNVHVVGAYFQFFSGGVDANALDKASWRHADLFDKKTTEVTNAHRSHL
jgi:hypothetical protein